VAKTIEIRRHTDNDGDALTAEGIRAAVKLGAGLAGDYRIAVSTGAQRATQSLACMFAGLGQRVADGVVVSSGLRSQAEDRWREVASQADGGDLSAFREVDAEFVDGEVRALGEALRGIVDELEEGGRALVVGHSPTNEAAVLGLTGRLVGPMSKGAGVLVVADGDSFAVETLD
jgi:broad specificity phosphatase PhoE